MYLLKTVDNSMRPHSNSAVFAYVYIIVRHFALKLIIVYLKEYFPTKRENIPTQL